MKSLLHRLAHLFNMYYGKVVTRLDGDKIIVGFRCDTCGTVDGEHEEMCRRDRWPQEGGLCFWSSGAPIT